MISIPDNALLPFTILLQLIFDALLTLRDIKLIHKITVNIREYIKYKYLIFKNKGAKI